MIFVFLCLCFSLSEVDDLAEHGFNDIRLVFEPLHFREMIVRISFSLAQLTLSWMYLIRMLFLFPRSFYSFVRCTACIRFSWFFFSLFRTLSISFAILMAMNFTYISTQIHARTSNRNQKCDLPTIWLLTIMCFAFVFVFSFCRHAMRISLKNE